MRGIREGEQCRPLVGQQRSVEMLLPSKEVNEGIITDSKRII